MRLPIRHIANGLLISASLLCAQAPCIGFARSVPVQGAATDLPKPDKPSSAADSRHYAQPLPASLGDVSRVYFADGNDSSVAGSVRTLRSVQRMLAEHPEVRRLRIEGHADDIGDPCFNLALSRRRVRGVVRWLLANGVSEDRLELFACGRRYVEQGSRPLSVRAESRRVELSVSEPAQGAAVHDRCDPISGK